MEKNIREIIKDNLAYYLKNSPLSQKEIADKLGVSKSSITNWLAGDNSPNIETLAKLCQILGVKMSEMLSDKVEITQSEKTILNKYRSLDAHGKTAVNSILDVEYNRCQTAQEQEQKQDNVINLPYYYGGVSAGSGIPSIDEYKVLRQVPRTALTEKADFIVQVNGDSMLPTYSDGDLLLIKSQQSVDVGEVGIFVIDCSEMYVKRFGGDRLIPDNKKYPDIEVSEDTICQGKVIGKL